MTDHDPPTDTALERVSVMAHQLSMLARWLVVAAMLLGAGLGIAVEGALVHDIGTLGPLSEFRSRATRWTLEGEGRLETAVISSAMFLSTTIVGTGIALALHMSSASLAHVVEVRLDRADALVREAWGSLGSTMGGIASAGLLCGITGAMRWGAGDYSTFYPNVGNWNAIVTLIAGSAIFNGHLAAFSRLDRGVKRASTAARLAVVATVILYLPIATPTNAYVVLEVRRAAPFLDALISTIAIWPAIARVAMLAIPVLARARWCRSCFTESMRRARPVTPASEAVTTQRGSDRVGATARSTREAERRLQLRLDIGSLAALLVFHSLLFVTYMLASDMLSKPGLSFVVAVVRAHVFPLPYLASLGMACSGLRDELVANLARSVLEAKVQHQRAFMRYLFHEIRVPLNTIALVLDDQMPLRDASAHDSEASVPVPGREGVGTSAIASRASSRVGHCKAQQHYSVEPDAAAALRAALEGATHLLSDVLTVEKIESGQFALEMNPFHPQQTLEQALVVFRAACRAKGITLTVQPALPVAATFVADEHRLRQVMSNFLSNAVKFTPPGGLIVASLDLHQRRPVQSTASATHEQPCTVPKTANPTQEAFPTPSHSHSHSQSAAAAGPDQASNVPAATSLEPVWLRFSVHDSGAGFTSTEGATLFEPFSQLRASMQQKVSGSGLGLSISRTIIEAHGGYVGCSSEGTSRGATFWFEVPSLPTGVDEGSVADLRERSISTSMRLTRACTTPTESGAAIQPRTPPPRPMSSAGRPLSALTEETTRRPHSAHTDEADHDRPVSIRTIRLPALLKGPQTNQRRTQAHLLLSTPTPTIQHDHQVHAGAHTQRVQTTPPTGASAYAVPQPSAFEGLHVILVDDSASVRVLMGKMLTRLGAAQVDAHAGAIPALLAIRDAARPIDVVITDLTMPDMDGCALTERLRRDGFAGVIIGATGHALEEDVHAMLGAGMDEVIVKPVSAEALVRALLKASAARATAREGPLHA